MELLKNAIEGWKAMNADGKYTLLLLAVLLWYWMNASVLRKQEKQQVKQHWLLCYGSLITIVVIVPITAVLLMKYQTRFYNYIWLWTLVPMTALIAWGGVQIYERLCNSQWKESSWKKRGGAAAGLLLLVLCGNLGGFPGDFQQQAQTREKAELLLDELTESGKNSNICLWAPREIIEYARAADGQIRLLYGRNMWDGALNAYSYDTYTPETVELYEWMEQLQQYELLQEETKAEVYDNAAQCIACAIEQGVDIIVLPYAIPDELKQQIQGLTETEGRDFKEEYLIYDIAECE